MRRPGKYYEQGLLVDDSNAAAWNNLGSIHTALERWDEAVACYESALQIDPAYANAHYNLGNVYKELGQPSDASACYRRALYIEPELAEAHINLGVTPVPSSTDWRMRPPVTRGPFKSVPMTPRRTSTAPSPGCWRAISNRAGTNTSGGSATT